MIMFVRMSTRLTVSGDVVLMEMKEPEQKQHEHQTAHNKIHGAVDRLSQLKTVWDKMKASHA